MDTIQEGWQVPFQDSLIHSILQWLQKNGSKFRSQDVVLFHWREGWWHKKKQIQQYSNNFPVFKDFIRLYFIRLLFPSSLLSP